MPESPDLQRLLQAKHEAVRAYREAQDEDARKIAWAGVDAASSALETELVMREQTREDESRASAIEARSAAAKITHETATKQVTGLPIDEIRAFARGESQGFSKLLPFELRNDFTTTDTNTYASYTVPQSWASSVIDFQIAGSGVLRAKPTIITTNNGNQINMPALTTDATSVAGAEGTAATVSNVVWGTRALNAYRFDGFFSVANELLADSGVNLEPLLRKYATRSIAAKINPYFADPDVGTGSSTIAAVQIGATTGKTAASYAAVTLDEQKELMYSVLPEYRMSGNAAWVGNSAVTLANALAKDDNGNYLWQPSNMASEPDRFMGYPWFEDAYMDSLATGNEPVVFGDMGAGYTVRYAHGGMQFIVSKEFAVTSFETTFVWGVWVDAVTTDVLAVKSLLLP